MKVLVLGASGHIGYSVTKAFVLAGHIVYGQTRSQITAEYEFGPNEILPVLCDPHSADGRKRWTAVAKDVDVLIDCLAANGPGPALKILDAFKEAVSHRPKGSPLPTYVYCSGHYVMARGWGGLGKWSDERQPADAPVNKGTIWRAEVENAVLASSAVTGIVIRPACVYGRGGSYFAEYHFIPALKAVKAGKDTFETIASEKGKILTVHADDVADLFVRVAERAPACRGQPFLAANPATDNLHDILDGVVRVSGLKGYKVVEPKDEFESAWITPLLARPSLGHALTGWAPRRSSVSDGIDIYWHSFLKSDKARAI